MTIQNFRKYLDPEFREDLANVELDKNNNPIKPRTPSGVDFYQKKSKVIPYPDSSVLRSRLDDKKRLARYNSRHVYGAFKDGETDTYVPTSEMTGPGGVLNDMGITNKQYQLYNKQVNDKIKEGGHFMDFAPKDMAENQDLYPAYDPEIPRPDGGKGDWIMKAGPKAKNGGISAANDVVFDTYNIAGESPYDRSILGNISTGFWNSAMQGLASGISMTSWANDMNSAIGNSHLGWLFNPIGKMSMPTKDKNEESEYHKAAAEWTEYLNTLGSVPSSTKVLDDPHSMDAFSEGIGSVVASLTQFGVGTAAGMGIGKTLGMGRKTAMYFGMVPTSMALNGGEAYKVASENGLSKTDRTWFTFAVGSIASAIEMTGANQVNLYMAGYGGRKKIAQTFARELGDEITPTAVKNATKRTIASTADDMKGMYQKLTSTPALGPMLEEFSEEASQSLTLEIGQIAFDNMFADAEDSIGNGRFGAYWDKEIITNALWEGSLGAVAGLGGGAMHSLSYRKAGNHTLANYVAGKREKDIVFEAEGLYESGAIDTEQLAEIKQRVGILTNIRDNNEELFNSYVGAEDYMEKMAKAITILDGNENLLKKAAEAKKADPEAQIDFQHIFQQGVDAFYEQAVDNVMIRNSKQFIQQLNEAGLPTHGKIVEMTEQYYKAMPKILKSAQYHNLANVPLSNYIARDKLLHDSQNLKSQIAEVTKGLLEEESSTDITDLNLRATELNTRLKYINKAFDLVVGDDKGQGKLPTLQVFLKDKLSKIKDKRTKEITDQLNALKEEGGIVNDKAEALLDNKNLTEQIQQSEFFNTQLDARAQLSKFYSKEANIKNLIEDLVDTYEKAEEEVSKTNKKANKKYKKTRDAQRADQRSDIEADPQVFAEAIKRSQMAAQNRIKANAIMENPDATEEERTWAAETIAKMNWTNDDYETLMGPVAVTESNSIAVADASITKLTETVDTQISKLKKNQTTVPNFAYRHKAGTGTVDEVNDDGSIKLSENTDLRLALPNFMKEGTPIVLYIDTKHVDYATTKKDLANVPIAIMTEEDYNKSERPNPSAYLHNLSWVGVHDDKNNLVKGEDGFYSSERVASPNIESVFNSTKSIRTELLGSELSSKKVFKSKVTSKGTGRNNHSKNYRNANTFLADNRVFFGLGVSGGFDVDFVNEAKVTPVLRYHATKGIPYMFFPNAAGSTSMTRLSQQELSATPELYEKYATIISDLVYDYLNKGKVTNKWSFSELRDALNTLVYTSENTKAGVSQTNETKVQADLENAINSDEDIRKDLIFNVFESGEGTVYVNLPSDSNIFDTLKSSKNEQGISTLYTTKINAEERTTELDKPLTKDDFRALLLGDEYNGAISKKFPNLNKEGFTNPSIDVVYPTLNAENEVVMKTGQYFDFMSENEIVSSNIQPIEVGGTLTYTLQPNIGFNPDLLDINDDHAANEFDTSVNDFFLAKKGKVDMTEAMKPKRRSRGSFGSKPNKPSTSNSITPSTSDLINIAKGNLNQLNIASFTLDDDVLAEEEIVKSITYDFIMLRKRLGVRQDETKGENDSRVMAALKSELQAYRDNALLQAKADPEDADYFNAVADSYDFVLQNFEFTPEKSKFIGYRNRIRQELDHLDFLVNFDEEETFDDENPNERYTDSDERNLAKDPEKSAAGRVKRFLYFTPDLSVDEEGYEKIDYLGRSVRLDYGTTYNMLLSHLADVPMEFIEEALENLASSDSDTSTPGAREHTSIAQSVLAALNKEGTSFKNEFYSVLKKHHNKMVTLIQSPAKKDFGSGSIRVMASNTRGSVGIVTTGWKNDFMLEGLKTGLIEKDDATRSYIVNRKAALSLKGRYSQIFQNTTLGFKDKKQAIVDIFNELGIGITMTTLDNMQNDYKYNSYFFRKFFDVNKKGDNFIDFFFINFSRIIDSLTSSNDVAADPYQQYNPFFAQQELMGILAKYYLRENPETYSTSFKSASNKQVFGYVEPSYATDRVQRFKDKDDAFLSLKAGNAFSKRSSWLNTMINPPKLKNTDITKIFDYWVMDASKNIKSFEGAIDLTNQSNKEREVTRLNLYLNSNARYKAYFLWTTPSDKSRIPIMSAPRYKMAVEERKRTFFKNEIDFGNAKGVINTLLSNVVMPEVDRINQTIREVAEAKAKGADNARRAGREMVAEDWQQYLDYGYHYVGEHLGTGAMFNLIPELNGLDIIDDTAEKAIEVNPDGQLNAEDQIVVKEFLVNYFNMLTQERVDFWEKSGIVNKTKQTSLLDFNYMKSKLTQVENTPSRFSDAVNSAAGEYVVNYAIAATNIAQLFDGDPAQFVKVPRDWNGDYRSILTATIPNLFKRAAKDVAPGPEGKFHPNASAINYAFINAGKVAADVTLYSDRLKKYFGSGNYQNMDHTDGVEYITIKEYVENLYAYGDIKEDSEYDDMMDRINNNRNLTPNQLSMVLTPLKQVYVDSALRGTTPDGPAFEKHFYFKTSAMPLIPQITRHFPNLDKFRKTVENSGVDRVVTTSGAKLGAIRPMDVFDENGDFLSNIEIAPDRIITLERKGLRKQQDVPYSATKKEIVRGSQYAVLQYADLDNGLSFDLGKFGAFSASELYHLDGAITTDKYKSKFTKLLSELGLTEIEAKDGQLIYEPGDLNRIKNILIDEATQRKGWDYNDLLLLNVLMDSIEGGQAFEVPLFFHPSINKIESLLNSLINNRVLSRKLPGKSYVQEPSAGFTGGKVLGEAFLSEFGDSQITFTKDYRANDRLRYLETDGVIEAEVMVPFYFKGADGQPLSINNYIKDGYLDTEKMDESLLNIIGYRIPTQGHSSMVKLKVVGFLPKNAGDLIIVPAEMIAQMGSDFDIDKLFTHHFNYDLADNGYLSKVENSIKTKDELVGNIGQLNERESQNLLMDITYAIMGNPKVAEMQAESLDNSNLNDLADAIDKLAPKPKQAKRVQTIIDVGVQDEYMSMGSAGKTGIAIASSSSVNHVYAQYANLHIGDKIKDKAIAKGPRIGIQFLDENGDMYYDSMAGKAFVENRTTSLPTKVVNEAMAVPFKGLTGNEHPYSFIIENSAWRLDKIKGFDGSSILANIRDIQTGSVDNANNPVLHRLNLNSETFDVGLLLLKAGIPLGEVGFFLRQPVIVDYINAVKDSKGFSRGELEASPANKFREDVLKEGKLLKDQAVTAFSKKQLGQMIRDNNADLVAKAKVLQNFLLWKMLAEDLSEVQNAFNTQSKHLNRSIYSTIYKDEKVKFLKAGTTRIKNIGNLAELNTVTGGAYEYGVKKGSYMYNSSKLLPIRSKVLAGRRGVISEIARLMGVKSELESSVVDGIITDVRNSIYSTIVPALFINDSDIKGKDIEELRHQLLYGDEAIARRVQILKGRSDNVFISSLVPVLQEEFDKPSSVEYLAARGMSEGEVLKIQQGWLDLFNAPTDSFEYKVGRDLLLYAFLTGNERNAKDFGRFIPVDMYRRLGLDEMLHNIDFHSGQAVSKLLMKNFPRQWFQHNPFRAQEVFPKDVKRYSLEKPNEVSSSSNVKVTLTLKDVEDEGFNQKLLIQSERRGEQSMPEFVFTFNKATNKVLLYERNRDEKKNYEYKLIPTLGFKPTLMKEFNLLNEEQTSVIAENFQTYLTKKQEERDSAPAVTELSILEDNLIKRLSRDLKTKREIGKEVMNNAGFNGTFKEALQGIVDNGVSVANKGWAKLLLDKQSRINIDSWRLEFYNPENQDHWSNAPLEDYYPSEAAREQDTAPHLKGRVALDKRLLTLNPNTIQTREDYEKAFLHEASHAYLKYLINNYEFLNSEEKSAVNSLRALVANVRRDQAYIKSLRVDDTAESSEILYALGLLEGFEIPMSSPELINEFTAVMLTNPKFQNDLNEMNFTNKKSFIDRIIEIVHKLFGINVRKNSILAAATHDILFLLDTNESIERINEAIAKEEKAALDAKIAAANSGGATKQILDTYKGIKGTQRVREAEKEGLGISALRKHNTEKHYGNPFSGPKTYVKGAIIADSPTVAVDAFSDWLNLDFGGENHSLTKYRASFEVDNRKLADIEPERRAFIIDQIKSGALDNVNFLYHQDIKRSHVDILLDAINTSKESRNMQQVEDYQQANERMAPPEDSEFYHDDSFNPFQGGGIKIDMPTSDSIVKQVSTNKKLIARKETHKEVLYNRLSQKGSNRTEISTRISRLEAQIDTLQRRNSTLTIEKTVLEDINASKTILETTDELLNRKDLTFQELHDIFDNLSTVGHYIDTWQNYDEMLGFSFSESRITEMDKMLANINRLHKAKVKLQQKALLQTANNYSYRNDFTHGELFHGVKDISDLTKNVLGLHHSNSNMVKVAHDMIQSMQNGFTFEYYKKRQEVLSQVRDVKKATGQSGDALWMNFMQKKDNGNLTGGYVTEYKQEFWEAKQAAFKEAQRTKNWNIYKSFMKKNTKTITSEMIKGEDRGFWTAKQFEEQKEKYNEYLELRDAFRDSMLNDPNLIGEDGNFLNESAEKLYNTRMENWININSPLVYNKYLKGETRKPKGAKGRNKYLNEDTPIDSWKDANYTKMRSNTALSKFYDYMIATFKENNGLLPYGKGRPANYIPELEKNFVETLTDSNLASVMGGIGKGVKDALIVQSSNTAENALILGGKTIKFLPVNMMGNRLAPNKKSLNIEKILLGHTAVGVGYKVKSQTEPLLNAMLDLLSEMSEGDVIKVGTDFIPKETITGELSETTKPLQNTRDHLEDTMKALLYNDYKNENKLFKRYSKEEQLEIDDIKKQLETITDPTERARLLMELDGMGKSLNINPLADGLITLTYTLGLGFPNVLSPIVNGFYGLMSNLTHSAAGKYVTDKNILKGTAMMMGAISRRAVTKIDSKNLIKIYSFMDNIDLLTNIVEVNYGGVKKVASMLVVLQSKAEYINQGAMMIGIMKTLKMKDKNGNDTSAWDAFTVDKNNALVWNTALMGEYKELGGKDLLSEDKRSVNMDRLAKLVHSEIRKAHGDYKSVMVGKRKAWFRQAMLFKTWLAEAVDHRFGELNMNPDTQEYEKGRYRSFFTSTDSLGKQVSVGKTMAAFASNMYKLSQQKSFKDFSELDKTNLARNVREMQFVLILSGIGLLLTQAVRDRDDEDDNFKMVTFMLINALNKSRADLMLYFDPRASLQIFSNVFPTLTTLVKAGTLIDVIQSHITGDGRIEQGPFKGMNKATKWGADITPGASGTIKMINAGSKLYEYQ